MVDLSNVKRPENLMPGDKVKVWGDDLTVDSAQPAIDGLHVTVNFDNGDSVEYPAGVLVETAGG